MKFQCPRGTRDFYPPEMAIRNWIVGRWRRVSERNGFEEYDGPIFENLDLYRVKSGEAIVGELFHFKDRGDREFAIRPEMTPTLARMVSAQASSLPRPVKWFSVPRLCRAERPQRGRLREFFQWNIDILGEESVLADAECVFVAADFFRDVGLGSEHFVIKISSRSLLAAILEHAGVEPHRFDAIYAVLDKRAAIPNEAFEALVDGLSLTTAQREMLLTLGEANGPEGVQRVGQLVQGHAVGEGKLAEIEQLFAWLDRMGVGDCCRFDMSVVRGLAYYTGIVFEAFGRGGLKRAICGGGRYDRLLKEVGGPPMTGTGFATSDVVIQDLLTEFDLLPCTKSTIDVFVIDANASCFDNVLSVTTALRARNFSAAFSYKRQAIGKQLRQAAAKSARRAVIVEVHSKNLDVVQVKDLQTGVQQSMRLDELLTDPFCTLET